MMRAAALLLLLLAVSACTAIRWEGDRPVSDWTLATLQEIVELRPKPGSALCVAPRPSGQPAAQPLQEQHEERWVGVG